MDFATRRRMFPASSTDDTDRAGSQPVFSAHCPVCGGLLLERRGESRCTRCQFVVCQSCDGECPAIEGDSSGW
jgi:hypothetical protein